MTEKDVYEVTIEGLGLQLKRAVPKEIGDKIIVLIISGNYSEFTEKISKTTNSPSKQTIIQSDGRNTISSDKNTISIREFLDKHEAKRAVDKVTAIGVFLKIYRDQKFFTKEDLEKNLQDAAEPVSTNLYRDILWAKRAGWITLGNGEKDKFYVTISGEQAVSNKFPKEIIKKTRGLLSKGKKNNLKLWIENERICKLSGLRVKSGESTSCIENQIQK